MCDICLRSERGLLTLCGIVVKEGEEGNGQARAIGE